ncbi:MAG: hypothetical protein M3Q84_06055, partial [Actinomycetota bacterium]|nr:hypothetical protein [Actinomycetota bacterium]
TVRRLELHGRLEPVERVVVAELGLVVVERRLAEPIERRLSRRWGWQPELRRPPRRRIPPLTNRRACGVNRRRGTVRNPR